MQNCEKCGGSKIVGPTYDRVHDQLNYKCWTCGFKWSGPTKDKRLLKPEDLFSKKGSS